MAVGVVVVRAQTPEEKGLAITQKAKERGEGYGSMTAKLTMTLRNKRGQESIRELRIKVLESDVDFGDRTLFVFDIPRDVQGTAFLIHSHQDKDDDQWIYLPALKRVKRISGANKSGSFMGSEFSYEDMGAPEISRFSYEYLRDEPCPDDSSLTCTVIERIPTTKSHYTKQLVWQDTEELLVRKVEYYDRKESHLKTLLPTGYTKHNDQFWHATLLSMENHQTGKSTDLAWSEFEYGAELDDSEFSQAGLRRAR